MLNNCVFNNSFRYLPKAAVRQLSQPHPPAGLGGLSLGVLRNKGVLGFLWLVLVVHQGPFYMLAWVCLTSSSCSFSPCLAALSL